MNTLFEDWTINHNDIENTIEQLGYLIDGIYISNIDTLKEQIACNRKKIETQLSELQDICKTIID